MSAQASRCTQERLSQSDDNRQGAVACIGCGPGDRRKAEGINCITVTPKGIPRKTVDLSDHGRTKEMQEQVPT